MRTIFIALCILAGAPALGADSIAYTGSSTIGKFISDAAAVYGQASFTISTLSESRGGQQCAIEATCDIGGVARDVDDAELTAAGVVKTLIGHDVIAAVVHADNPVRDISSDALAAIFTGELSDWRLLGGPALPIRAYVVHPRSATHAVFRQRVLDGREYAGATVVEPDARMIRVVASEPGAIGQLSTAFLRYGDRGIKPLAVDGYTVSGAEAGYPIARPLYLLTPGPPAGRVKAFIDWALGPEGQAVLRNRFAGAR